MTTLMLHLRDKADITAACCSPETMKICVHSFGLDEPCSVTLIPGGQNAISRLLLFPSGSFRNPSTLLSPFFSHYFYHAGVTGRLIFLLAQVTPAGRSHEPDRRRTWSPPPPPVHLQPNRHLRVDPCRTNEETARASQSRAGARSAARTLLLLSSLFTDPAAALPPPPSPPLLSLSLSFLLS